MLIFILVSIYATLPDTPVFGRQPAKLPASASAEELRIHDSRVFGRIGRGGRAHKFTCARGDLGTFAYIKGAELRFVARNKERVVWNRGVAPDPVLSPDGKKLLFIAVEQGKRILRVYDTEADRIYAIGADDMPKGGYCWSPDGRRIAYSEIERYWISGPEWKPLKRVMQQHKRTYISKADGTGNRFLIEGIVQPGFWSPAGDRVVVLNPERVPGTHISKSGISIVDVETGEATKLAVPGYFPVWSPDGSKLCYRMRDKESGRKGLRVIDFTTNRAFEFGTRNDGHPTWSPDGTKLAFRRIEPVEARGGVGIVDSDIWVVNFDGTGMKNLTHTDHLYEKAPRWIRENQILIEIDGGGREDDYALHILTIGR